METSGLLVASWAHWNKASLYAKWAKDNPGEDDKLRYYWNHEGPVPQLKTETGQAYVLEAQGYWNAFHLEALTYHAPFEADGWVAKQIVARPSDHPVKPLSGFAAAYDFRVSPGTVIYAPEDCSCKHVYPDAVTEAGGNVPGSQEFTVDGQSGFRWHYAHVLRPETLPHRPKKGDPIGTCAGSLLHFSGNNASELDRLVYST